MWCLQNVPQPLQMGFFWGGNDRWMLQMENGNEISCRSVWWGDVGALPQHTETNIQLLVNNINCPTSVFFN